MTIYADSSALIPLYVNERFSESAEAVLRRAGQIPFTALHQLEVPNAFERLVGRGLMMLEKNVTLCSNSCRTTLTAGD